MMKGRGKLKAVCWYHRSACALALPVSPGWQSLSRFRATPGSLSTFWYEAHSPPPIQLKLPKSKFKVHHVDSLSQIEASVSVSVSVKVQANVCYNTSQCVEI